MMKTTPTKAYMFSRYSSNPGELKRIRRTATAVIRIAVSREVVTIHVPRAAVRTIIPIAAQDSTTEQTIRRERDKNASLNITYIPTYNIFLSPIRMLGS